ncbi:MAG: HD domain-containing protein [Candidatus Bathyarchaeota archaeon]|nr:HD domain-containing protein [Candidatus Bathyarchaeota archaeon]MDD4325253.1 HD domain-containing protein [Candidatus Bathyarchaeota archaeon]MDI9579029.1 HD domain-containing protein [Thermoproteota archaeon]MDT8781866.1 HD domain-containing protein [Candidatus Bathyarchaeota archaeon]NLD65090.1 HD domain-containing protein [Thermoproteota archaeon]
MPKAYWGEIKDPVHGYVYITEAEKNIIDTYSMQRLRRLRQLAGSEYVYPGANHTRFEHSLGVMYLAGQVLENPNISRVVSDEEIDMCRVSALLHDCGHGPFSHVFEHLLIKNLGKTHEDITAWIIEKSEVSDKLSKMGYNSKEIAGLAVGKLQKKNRAFLDQIISSAVDVDKQDFIVRDTYHTGAEYGFVDVYRLIHALDLLGENLAVELGALSALEAFFIARIESFKSIYFHRVGRAAQIMLATAMEKANNELGLTAFKTPEEYLKLDDYTVWAALKKCKASNEIISNLEHRRMLKCAYERTFYEKDAMISNLFSGEAYRSQVQTEIAKEAGVKMESVIIDVPTVPSVPYHHAVLMESRELPVFVRSQSGGKKLRRLSETSKIFETLKGFMNILRVYTNSSDRAKVEVATEKILGVIP